MDIIQYVREEASKNIKHIVLPRSPDPRVIKAAEYLHEHKLCIPILLNNEEAKPSSSVPIFSIHDHPKLELYAESFYQKRKHKGLTKDQALNTVKDPLFFCSSMLAHGDANGAVAGLISTTGDVLRAAIQTIGLKKGSNVVSSSFLMSFEDGRIFTYGDCAVVPYPTSEQLASIAIDSAETHERLTGNSANVAMLSFSTLGSAKHERVDVVKHALELVKNEKPDLNIDGELQLDASIDVTIAGRKAPSSKVEGQANVLVFPNLEAGNIGYKITERLAGATATGPIIQGLAKPMMDLSRGCAWEDIVNVACVAALMS